MPEWGVFWESCKGHPGKIWAVNFKRMQSHHVGKKNCTFFWYVYFGTKWLNANRFLHEKYIIKKFLKVKTNSVVLNQPKNRIFFHLSHDSRKFVHSVWCKIGLFSAWKKHWNIKQWVTLPKLWQEPITWLWLIAQNETET